MYTVVSIWPAHSININNIYANFLSLSHMFELRSDNKETVLNVVEPSDENETSEQDHLLTENGTGSAETKESTSQLPENKNDNKDSASPDVEVIHPANNGELDKLLPFNSNNKI